MCEEVDIIYSYFKLPKKIDRAKRHWRITEYTFWEQSFTNCALAFDDNGNPVRNEPYQKQVDRIVDLEALIEDVVSMLKFKYQEFSKYLSSLNKIDKRYLVTKFNANSQVYNVVDTNMALEHKTVNECNQIEEAVGYRYGFQTDKAIDINDDYQHNLRNMLSMFGD